MEFDIEFLREIQVYLYVVVTGILVLVFYLYIYYLYSSDKKGKTNYEKNANIALYDDIHSTPVESRPLEDKNNGANK